MKNHKLVDKFKSLHSLSEHIYVGLNSRHLAEAQIMTFPVQPVSSNLEEIAKLLFLARIILCN